MEPDLPSRKSFGIGEAQRTGTGRVENRILSVYGLYDFTNRINCIISKNPFGTQMVKSVSEYHFGFTYDC